MSLCSREKVLMCTQKREMEILTKCRGFSMYSMNKTGGRRKMFISIGQIRQVAWAAALLSPFSSPSLKWNGFGFITMGSGAPTPSGKISSCYTSGLCLRTQTSYRANWKDRGFEPRHCLKRFRRLWTAQELMSYPVYTWLSATNRGCSSVLNSRWRQNSA